MGMGYCSAFADTMKPEDVQKLCPKEYKALIKALDTSEDGETLDSFAQEATFNEELDDGKSAVAYKALCAAFEKKTGLGLGVGYHDSQDEGSRYDDVDGAYWWLDGVMQYSPAGNKLKELISRQFWVTFG